MKKYYIRMLMVLLSLTVIMAVFNIAARFFAEESISSRNIIAQRITREIEEFFLQADDVINSVKSEDVDAVIRTVFLERREEWQAAYGKQSCPDEIKIILFSSDEKSRFTTKSGTIVSGLYLDNELAGLAEYVFPQTKNEKLILFMNICLVLAMLIFLIYPFWVYKKILQPFKRFSEYPKKLSKGQFNEKLPETKNKFFGDYIWGMNMLSDKLKNDREAIKKLTVDRQKFVTTMVHGIKTPASSIKLLAEAISTGLYADGKINEKDAELAERIKKNTEQIEELVTKAIKEGETTVFDYDPKVEPFYKKRVEEYVVEEYSNTLKMNHIPFKIEADRNLLINSDLDGVCRILRQLMDNAIKYGNGSGIALKIKSNDEGHFISIENKGLPLPESEIAYVFNSLWRGSNSKGVEGHGIGLYESRQIARKLGGDIIMRVGENITEVTIFLPK